MAGRVNTKFVIILASTLALLCLAAVGFYYTFVRKSASEYEAMGNRHFTLAQERQAEPADTVVEANEKRALAGKDYRLAAEFYGNAFKRDRSNVDVLLKYIAACRRMTVANQAEAMRVLQQVYGLTREATELRRDDTELLEDFYQMVYGWAREFNAASFYNDLTTLTANKLESDPDNIPALKFQAIMNARNLSDTVDRDKQQQVKADLERVLEVSPGDTDALHHLARWYLFDADRLQRARGDAQAIADLRAKAVELATKAFEENPNDGEVVVEYLDTMLMLADSYAQSVRWVGTEAERKAMIAKHEETLAVARPVLEGLEAYLLTNPDPAIVVQRVAEMLPRLFREPVADAAGDDAPETPRTSGNAGIQRTERLLRAAVAKKPQMLLYQLMLANVLKLQLQLDEAHAVYLKARDQRIEGPAEASLRDEGLRQQAVFEVANIELIRAEAATDPATRTAILKDADKAVADLEAVAGEDDRVLLLKGKIALLRGENTKAMVAIDKASDLRNGQDIEALLLSARARQEEQQWGAAAARLEQVLKLINTSARPEAYTNIRLQLAELLTRSRKFEQARAQIDAVLETEPENVTALRLRAQWFASQEKYDQAIAVLESPQLKDDPEVRKSLAQLYRASGEVDRGTAMLEEAFNANPADIRVLQQLLALAETPEAKLALIDRAAAAGADPGAVSMLRMQAAGEGRLTIEQVVERIDASGEEPLDIALRKAQVYQQVGRFEDAKPFFEAARELAPNDSRVVVMAMDTAIREKDFEQARALVAEAGRQNLDLANGHFMRGKLSAAEGDLPQAISSFEQGLKERPVFAEGWRQYGDLRLAAGDPEAAVAAYGKALEQQPDNAQALLGMANAEDARGRRTFALEALRTAVQYAPGNTGLVDRYLAYEERHGDAEVAMRVRGELAESQPQNIGNRLNLAILAARNGDLDRALEIIDAIDADQDKSGTTVAARATALAGAERVDEGRAVLDAWIAERGGEATSDDHLMLARYALSTGDAAGSLEAYRRAVAVEDPERRLASRELADVLFNSNQLDQAIPLYEQLYAASEGEDKERVGQRLVESLLRAGRSDQAETVLNGLEPGATTDALRSILARQRGNPEEALAMLNRSLASDPQNVMTLLQRAEVLAADPATREAALADLDKALAINSGLARGLEMRATLLMRMGRQSEAIRSLESLLELSPGNAAARYQLAQVYLQNNDRASARTLVDKGLELDPQNPGWLDLSAALALQAGRTDDAVAALEKRVGIEPTVPSLAQLADAYLTANKVSAADALLNEHPQLLNDSPALQGVRGRVLAKLNRADEARRVLTLALQRAETGPVLNDVVGQVMQALPRHEAVALIESVDAPANLLGRNLILAQMAMQAGDFDLALGRLSTLRQTTPPTDAATLRQVDRMEALARYQSGDFRGAQAAYMRLLEGEPDDVEVLNNLAYLLAKDLEDPAAAVPMAEKAAQLASNNPEVLDTLGWTYFKVGRTTDARQALENSTRLRLLPANTLHLGQVYLELDLPDRAREQLTRSLELAERSGDDDGAAEARAYLERIPE